MIPEVYPCCSPLTKSLYRYAWAAPFVPSLKARMAEMYEVDALPEHKNWLQVLPKHEFLNQSLVFILQ